MMNNQQEPRQQRLAREQALYLYTTALEQGDMETIIAVLQAAEHDGLLERMILEVHTVYQTEEDAPPPSADLEAVAIQRAAPVPTVRLSPGGKQVSAHTRLWRLRTLTEKLVAVLLVGILLGSSLALWLAHRGGQEAQGGGAQHPVVVVGLANGIIRALRDADGSTLWSYQAGHQRFFYGHETLVAFGDTVYAAFNDGSVYALQIDTGRLLWSQVVSPPPDDPNMNVRIAADSAVVAINLFGEGNAHQLVVYQAQSGRRLWTYQDQGFRGFDSFLGVGSRAVYVTEQAPQGRDSSAVTRALRETDGTPLWGSSHAIAPPLLSTTIPVSNGVLYGYSTAGSLIALNARTGKLLWEQKAAQDLIPLRPKDEQEWIPWQVAVESDLVYLMTPDQLCTYQINTGRQVWCTKAKQRASLFEYSEELERVVVMDGSAYLARGSFNPEGFQIEAWNATQSLLRWSWPASKSTLSPDISWSIVGGHGVIFIPSEQGLYALQASDGRQLWFAPLVIQDLWSPSFAAGT